MAKKPTQAALERLYRKYNRRALVHPDPLEFLYGFEDLRDREVAAVIAATLAYGRVAQIIKSVGAVLEVLGPNPAQVLLSVEPRALFKSLGGFVHRFATGESVCALLSGIRTVLERRGSLEACFLHHRLPGENSVVSGLCGLVEEITAGTAKDPGHLLPQPDRGSACKRLHLFLRWMVRKDAVDPGGWDQVSPAELIVPLDTHMHRAGRRCGFTRRNSGNLQTALEITDGFRSFCPEDPVRYDFALTRVGMRGDAEFRELFQER